MHHQNQLTHKQLNHLLNLLLNRLLLLDQLLHIQLHQPEDTLSRLILEVAIGAASSAAGYTTADAGVAILAACWCFLINIGKLSISNRISLSPFNLYWPNMDLDLERKKLDLDHKGLDLIFDSTYDASALAFSTLSSTRSTATL